MKYFICMMIAAGILHACSPKPEYVIKGELTGANGMKVTLTKIIANSDYSVKFDSCIVKKGKFRMKGTVEYPEYCGLYVGDNGPLLLIVENTEINIAVNLKNIQDSKITGSKETDLLAEYNSQVARMDTIPQQRIEYMKRFASEHPGSMVTAMIVNNNLIFHLDPEELETYANGFGKSPWVRHIKEKTNRISIGQPFVDVRMPSPDGNEIALSDYAGKGKYVLINFWASWSKLCRAANPHMAKLYHRYKDKGFEMVGISLDKDKTEWVEALQADTLAWPQMSDLKFWQSEGARLYSVNSIPYTVLLDKDGKILSSDDTELEKKLAVLME